MATTFYMSGISLIIQYLTNLGLMNAGGQVFTFVGGSASTPVTTYTDSTGIVQNANPMTLDSTGRPKTPSSAPAAFWVPGGTLVQLQVFDALGNQLFFLDNVPSFNDLTTTNNALQTLLASAASSNASGSGPVAGADLVANAVKSYDVIADVRAANAPVLASGQTLNIDVQGGVTVNDGLGGFFYWAPSSTTTDDGRTTLKPNSLTIAQPGRWLRYYPLGVPQIITKTSNFAVQSQTSPQNDPQLLAVLAAGATYLIQLRLQVFGITTTTQGWKAQCVFGGSIAQGGGAGGVVSGNNTAVTTYTPITTAFSNAAITLDSGFNADVINLDAILTTTAGGNFVVAFAQNSSSANASVLASGSSLIVTRIG